MGILKGLLMAVFFLIELGSLAAFGYWGFQTGSSSLMRIVLGIGTPLLVAVFWGIFVAPKATVPVPIPLRVTLQLLVFASASWALYEAGQKELAAIFLAAALVIVISSIMLKTY